MNATGSTDVQYDHIILGAGSAGAVLAYRLTEAGHTRVWLLGAGRVSHSYTWTWLPVSCGLLSDNPAANWRFRSEPEPGTANREIPVPRGKLLGGMGPGPNAVVDDQLKVHGLEGLRIADASIMPTMTSGNTNAPCIMIGEKAADLLRAA